MYGLLGLAREVDRSAIVVDYSKSIAKVNREATAKLILCNKSLDILSSFQKWAECLWLAILGLGNRSQGACFEERLFAIDHRRR